MRGVFRYRGIGGRLGARAERGCAGAGSSGPNGDVVVQQRREGHKILGGPLSVGKASAGHTRVLTFGVVALVLRPVKAV